MSTASTEAKSRDGNKPKKNDEERKRLVRYDEYYDYRTYSSRLKKTSKPEKKGKKNTKGVVLMARRIIDVKGRPQSTEIDIKSTALVQLLERLNPEVESLELHDLPVADPVLFYHSRVGLRDGYDAGAAKEKPDEELVKALEVALQHIEEDHGVAKASMDSLLGREEITWKLLWALFVPNKPVYHFDELTQQHQMLRFRKVVKRFDRKLGVDYWQIVCDMIVFDGQKFGYVRVDHFRIDQYLGAMKIYDLPTFPVEFFKDNKAMIKKLVDTGKRYAAITGSTYLECEGPAMHEILNEALEPKQFTFSAFGRAMVDADGFRTFEPKASYNYRVYKQLDRDLSDDQFAICSGVVLGFSFGPKLWGALGMDHIHPITWGHTAFPSLILDPAKKTLIHSLVTQHALISPRTTPPPRRLRLRQRPRPNRPPQRSSRLRQDPHRRSHLRRNPSTALHRVDGRTRDGCAGGGRAADAGAGAGAAVGRDFAAG